MENNLLANTTDLAKRRFSKQPLRVWVAKIGSHSWRAFAINADNKVLLCVGPVSENYDESLSGLKIKLDGLKRKTV